MDYTIQGKHQSILEEIPLGKDAVKDFEKKSWLMLFLFALTFLINESPILIDNSTPYGDYFDFFLFFPFFFLTLNYLEQSGLYISVVVSIIY